MIKPFFTIITPTLNSKKYLKECIESVENQSFKKWEHIFIDSFSKDGTMGILKKYKQRNPSNVFIYQFPKKGISNAFNKGLSKANGKWIGFLGSDDLYEPDIFKRVHNQLSETDHTWGYGNVIIINENGKIIKENKHRHFNYKKLFDLFTICHQAVFMNKTIFEKYGLFNEDLKYVMDHEIYLRIGIGEVPTKLEYPICKFRKSLENTTSKEWRGMLSERKKVNLEYTKEKNKFLIVLVNKLVLIKKRLF